jgi:hypothetical protein
LSLSGGVTTNTVQVYYEITFSSTGELSPVYDSIKNNIKTSISNLYFTSLLKFRSAKYGCSVVTSQARATDQPTFGNYKVIELNTFPPTSMPTASPVVTEKVSSGSLDTQQALVLGVILGGCCCCLPLSALLFMMRRYVPFLRNRKPKDGPDIRLENRDLPQDDDFFLEYRDALNSDESEQKKELTRSKN